MVNDTFAFAPAVESITFVRLDSGISRARHHLIEIIEHRI